MKYKSVMLPESYLLRKQKRQALGRIFKHLNASIEHNRLKLTNVVNQINHHGSGCSPYIVVLVRHKVN